MEFLSISLDYLNWMLFELANLNIICSRSVVVTIIVMHIIFLPHASLIHSDSASIFVFIMNDP